MSTVLFAILWFLYHLFVKASSNVSLQMKGWWHFIVCCTKKMFRGSQVLARCWILYDSLKAQSRQIFYFPSWMGVKSGGSHACISKSNSLYFVPAQKLASSCNLYQNFPHLLLAFQEHKLFRLFLISREISVFEDTREWQLHLEA